MAFLALRSTMLHGRVLRSGDPQGLRQEMWALPTVYQLLRMAMSDATDTITGCDPDRACFTAAPAGARDTVTRAAQIIPAPGSEPTSSITQAVTAALLPERRPRISARTVKGASARYAHRPADEDRPLAGTPVTAIDITIHPPQTPVPVTSAPDEHSTGPVRLKTAGSTSPAPARRPEPPQPHPLLPPPVPNHTSRLEDILALMGTDPQRGRQATELATLLRLAYKNFAGSLYSWARRGILTRTGPGTFKIPEGPARPLQARSPPRRRPLRPGHRPAARTASPRRRSRTRHRHGEHPVAPYEHLGPQEPPGQDSPSPIHAPRTPEQSPRPEFRSSVGVW
ncbi:hypothetical protein [Streptomyces sp. NPDC057910]|uniref:hypothetical protein n=1 Tax=Streptomyces sp. NPDC057910 TaxID=3346278 RepID=UPI0036EF0F54